MVYTFIYFVPKIQVINKDPTTVNVINIIFKLILVNLAVLPLFHFKLLLFITTYMKMYTILR